MRRRLARPFGHNASQTRLLSLLMALAVIGLIYQRAKDPQLWRWLTNESRADSSDDSNATSQTSEATTNNSPLAALEEIVAGPNETDADELEKLRSNLKFVEDRVPLSPHEMSAYWRLMAWSRTRPFAELEKLARRDVPYSHMWEEPDLYRGQPIRLKLHVRRVLSYEPSENPQGLKKVYELHGWTDNSLSFPFIVVVPEKPAGLKVGTDVEGDIVFVGYFLKWMGYRAFDTAKSAPLLIGRAKPASRGDAGGKEDRWETSFLILVGGVLLLSFIGWFAIYGLRRPRTIVAATTSIPDQLPANWVAGSSAEAPVNSSEESLDFATSALRITAEATAPTTTPLPMASSSSVSADTT